MIAERQNRRADDLRIQELAEAVERNTEMTEEIRENTADIVYAWKAIEGFIKVLTKVAVALKYASYVAMAVGAFASAWYAIEQLSK